MLWLSWKIQQLHPTIPAHTLSDVILVESRSYIFELNRSINAKLAILGGIVPLLHSLSHIFLILAKKNSPQITVEIKTYVSLNV